jgi:GT2 family glycosyltransferase
MKRISINLLGWNHREKIGAAIRSVLAQTFSDYDFFYMDNGSTDGSVDFVKKNFPAVSVVENGRNLGYAGAHNLFIQKAQTEFVMVLNPDVVLDANFLREAILPFADPKVAAVTGKMLKPPRPDEEAVLDGTGIVVGRSRRGRERGQLEVDRKQYDGMPWVFGVSGAAAIFRRSALLDAGVPKKDGGKEFFDEDFFAYWEDMDLSWRLRLAGYECRFASAATAYHPRVAGSSKGGYLNFFAFVRNHKKLSPQIKRWNWKNHLFCIIKNDFGRPFWWDCPFIFIRELAMFFFILIFETATLSVIPEFFRELPVMLKKRRYIQSNRKVSAGEVSTWFNH